MKLEKVTPILTECIVAASGPSLPETLPGLHHQNIPIIAVNDAYRLIPDAALLYACDAKWWDLHSGVPGFKGERWSSHDKGSNDKSAIADKYSLKLVQGRHMDGFSLDPEFIHYGSNGGFQAINLAILLGAKRIYLIGFDMHSKRGRHFFGDHPSPLSNTAEYENFIGYFEYAAKRLPKNIRIFNCTPGSALECFEKMKLEDIGKLWAAAWP